MKIITLLLFAALLTERVEAKTCETNAFYKAVNEKAMLSLNESLWKAPGSTSGPVSNADKLRIARRDVKRFKLSHDMLKRFKKEHFPVTSDYFNPTVRTTADTSLLNDSTYVKAFRQDAYYKSVNTRAHPVGHVFSIIGISTVAIMGFAALMLAIIPNRHN